MWPVDQAEVCVYSSNPPSGSLTLPLCDMQMRAQVAGALINKISLEEGEKILYEKTHQGLVFI